MKELHVGGSFGSASNGRLIAAGPLSKQPGTVPFRIVLLAQIRRIEKQNVVVGYVTHIEQFQDADVIDQLTRSVPCSGQYHSYLASGEYFSGETAIASASTSFALRVARNAESLGSLFREALAA